MENRHVERRDRPLFSGKGGLASRESHAEGNGVFAVKGRNLERGRSAPGPLWWQRAERDRVLAGCEAAVVAARSKLAVTSKAMARTGPSVSASSGSPALAWGVWPFYSPGPAHRP